MKRKTLLYRHKTLDTHEVFYIGIGTKKRSNQTSNRTKFWKNIVNKHGFYTEIVKDNLGWEEACELEELFIEMYGRRDLNTGCLVNLTNGGEGSPGVIVSKERREKLSKINTGKLLSEDHKRKIGLSNKGKKPAEITLLRQREVVSKKVIDTKTGIVYNSAKEVSELFNIKYLNLTRRLNGKIKNNTDFKYI